MHLPPSPPSNMPLNLTNYIWIWRLGGGNDYCNLEEGMTIATWRREWLLQLGGGNGYCNLDEGMAIAFWRREWLLLLGGGNGYCNL